MKRGDIVWVNLEPSVGAEANKTRPAIIVSNDHANAISARNGYGTITVVPLTSNTTNIYPFQVRIDKASRTGLPAASKAQAEQVRSIDVRRIAGHLGSINPDRLAQLDAALMLHLGLHQGT
jgi:mRNA interferase MazF